MAVSVELYLALQQKVAAAKGEQQNNARFRLTAKVAGETKLASPWLRSLFRAISKLPSKLPRAGREVFRGLNLDSGLPFQGVRHGSIHPSIAAAHSRQTSQQLPILQQFTVDPKTQLHFPEFGLLRQLNHPSHSATGLSGKTLAEIDTFVRQNPISVVPRGSASGADYPEWFDLLSLSSRAPYLSPGKTVQRGLRGSQISPVRLRAALSHETAVTPSQFSGLAAYDKVKQLVVPLPNNIARDLPNVRSV